MFEVFIVTKILVVVFWVAMVCSDVVRYQHLGRPCCL